MKNKWDIRFLQIALQISSWSKDPGTKVGAVITSRDRRILATGYNGFPKVIHDSHDRLNNRDIKLALTEHAERNAISNAAKSGVSLDNSILYITKHPCLSCLMGVLSTGIKKLVYIKDDQFEQRWKHPLFDEIILESKIEVIGYDLEDINEKD